MSFSFLAPRAPNSSWPIPSTRSSPASPAKPGLGGRGATPSVPSADSRATAAVEKPPGRRARCGSAGSGCPEASTWRPAVLSGHLVCKGAAQRATLGTARRSVHRVSGDPGAVACGCARVAPTAQEQPAGRPTWDRAGSRLSLLIGLCSANPSSQLEETPPIGCGRPACGEGRASFCSLLESASPPPLPAPRTPPRTRVRPRGTRRLRSGVRAVLAALCASALLKERADEQPLACGSL